MFERFGTDARRAVVAAHDEARRAGHDTIGCEHLLLALVTDRHSIAGQAAAAAGLDAVGLRAQIPGAAPPLDAEALASLGIDLDTVRRAVEAAFGPGALDRGPRPRPGRRAGHLPISREMKKSLELALRCAVGLKDRGIGPGHLLLGIIDQGDNAALRALAGAGVDARAVRLDLIARMTAAA
jgi:ATP-dependent Clp protease ATP-binding subunit ClpA